MLDHCAAGEVPSPALRTLTVGLAQGWHLWGTRQNGVDTQETQRCELAKKLHISGNPIVPRALAAGEGDTLDGGGEDAGAPSTAMQLDDLTCAVAHGHLLRLSRLGVGLSDYQYGCTNACGTEDVRLLVDPADGVGYPYQYFPDGGRVLIAQRYTLENGKLFQKTVGNSGYLWEPGAGALYCFSP